MGHPSVERKFFGHAPDLPMFFPFLEIGEPSPVRAHIARRLPLLAHGLVALLALGVAAPLHLPAWHVTHSYSVDKSVRDTGGRRVMPLATPPCGGVWFRLVAPDAEAIECEGADAQGRFLIASTRAAPQVECRVHQRVKQTAHAGFGSAGVIAGAREDG
jgi:hypothetical protein